MDKWSLIGLIVCAILVLIPVVMIGRFAIAILMAGRDLRAELAREVTHHVPGLGEFTSTDRELWSGEVSGLFVLLNTAGQPPTAAQAALVRDLLDNLPRLVELSRNYLLAHEDRSWFDGGTGEFEPYTIEPEDLSNFLLELVHPADIDGVYRVQFRAGVPVSSGRDD